MASETIRLSLRDTVGRLYHLDVVTEDECVFIGVLEHRERKVGQLYWSAQGEDWVLSDLRIRTQVIIRAGFLGWFRRTQSYRGKGLGSALLRFLIGLARKRGIKRIRGSVVQQDVDETPFLLAWYKKNGFQVLPPTPEELPHAIARVQLDLSQSPPRKPGCEIAYLS